MSFELRVDRQDRRVVVALCGECDVTVAGALHEGLLRALTSRPEEVVFDFSGLCFLDCAAARVLLTAGRAVLSPGGSLVVARQSPPVARLLALSGLGRQFRVVYGGGPALAA